MPSVLTSPSAVAHLRAADEDNAWGRSKRRLGGFLETPIGKALPELHLAAFMFSGRFFEFGKRLTGTSYVSCSLFKLGRVR